MQFTRRELPARFEGLYKTFGQLASQVIIPVQNDIDAFTRIATTIKRMQQGKVVFLYGVPGVGKSCFLYSLPTFCPQLFACRHSLPQAWDLPASAVATYIMNEVPVLDRITIVTVDQREFIDPAELRSMIVDLNSVLRQRPDVLMVWPITDRAMAGQAISLLRQAGGESAFVGEPVMDLRGLPREKFREALQLLLDLGGSTLGDFGIDESDIVSLSANVQTIGGFLDRVNSLISTRTDVSGLGESLPKLVFAVSSGDNQDLIQVCRNLRRASGYMLDADRLRMYTAKSNAIEYWNKRATEPTSALPYVLARFNASLVSLSPSSVVHACLYHGEPVLQQCATGVQRNRANARSAMATTEFVKYFRTEEDKARVGRHANPDTGIIYGRIQERSEDMHKAINQAILASAADLDDAPLGFVSVEFEVSRLGILTDAFVVGDNVQYAVEFHHKAQKQCSENKIAIYILEKLKEYAIAYGLAHR